MATFLDVSLLGGAKVVLTFLLIYVITFGLLSWIKPFGKDRPTGPYAIVAFAASILAIVSDTVRYLIEFMTPWFLFFVLFVFFILFVVRMFNVSEGDLRSLIAMGSVHTWIVVFFVLILLLGLGSAFGQRSLSATQGSQTPVEYNDMPTIGNGGPTQPAPTQGQPQPGQAGATATNDFSLNLINTLLHPKILAIIALFLIAMISIWLITQT